LNIYLKALGCRLNEAELETWANEFSARGHRVVDDIQNADLTVLNTCAVTSEAVRKSRKLINRTRRENPTAKLVVSGCFVSLPDQAEQEARNHLAAEHGIDMIVDNRDKDALVSKVTNRWSLPIMPQGATAPGEYSLFARNRHRAFIKIQDGCRYRCSYCIVTVARGEERSRAAADLINEINHHHSNGVQEIVLTGVHVGGYGSDIGQSLKTLVQTILLHTSVPRIRFASVEPWDLGDDFFSLFDNKRLMPHMHLPLQSGSDSVLRRMSRRCRRDDFAALIAQARTIDSFTATTDIIIGFPGETDEEWRQTMQFVEQIGFPHIHIFSYSARQGTKAANMPDQVPQEIKARRSKQLQDLALQMKVEQLKSMSGDAVDVLWEQCREMEGQLHATGYSPNFQRVAMPVPDRSSVNTISRCQITGFTNDYALAAPTSNSNAELRE